MALETQIVPISLAQGVDTKTDPKQVVPGKMLVLQNASFKSPKQIQKRDGFSGLTQTTSTGGSISSAVGVAAFQSELNVLDGQSLYSYSPGAASHVNRGALVPVDLSVQPVIRNSYAQTQPDSAYAAAAGLKVFTWLDSQSGGVNYSVLDSKTNAILVGNQVLSATGIRAKPILIGATFLIFYVDTATSRIMYRAISTAAPTVLGAAVTVASDLFTSLVYDVALIGGQIAVGYGNSATGSPTVRTISPSFVISSPVSIFSNPVLNAAAVFGDASGNIWFAYSNAGGVRCMVFSSALAVVLTATLVDSTPGDVRNITGIVSGTTATIAFESANTDPLLASYLRSVTCALSGTFTAGVTFARGLGLASKAFAAGGAFYALAVYAGAYKANANGVLTAQSEQPTYFLLNVSSGKIVMKLAPSLAGSYATQGLLSEALKQTASQVSIPYLIKDDLSSVNGNIVSSTGINDATLEFASGRPLSKLSLGNNLLLASGQMWAYDGANVVEQGFHLYPEPPTGDYIPATGALSVGQYQYIATYEWTDQQGNIHRSATSNALTVKVDGHLTAFSGSGVSGNTFITVSYAQYLQIGWAVSGPGVPAGTTITSVSFIAGHQSRVNLTAALTATSTNASFTITPQAIVPTALSTQPILAPTVNYIVPFNPSIGITILASSNGTNVITVSNPSVVFVGSSISASNLGAGLLTVTAVSGNQVTVSAPVISGFTNVPVQTYIEFTGSAVAGSNVITGVSPAMTAILKVGDTVANSLSTTPLCFITAITSTTVTLSANSTATGTATIDDYLGPSAAFAVGQQITGGTLVQPALVTAVAVKNGQPIVTLNQSVDSTLNPTYATPNFYVAAINVASLRQTAKAGVRLVLYRTQSNGTIFYQCSSVSSPTFNDPTVDSQYLFDGTSDAFLVGNTQLYTTGGEVDNYAAPAASAITSFKSRPLFLTPENPLQWGYGKQVIPGSPVEFSALTFYENVDQRIGRLSAIGTLDDKIVLFGPDSKYYVVGSGPSPSGTNNDFTEATKIPGATGCANQASVVEIPIGLMYQDPQKGIYLLERSMQELYVGADVEAYGTLVITSSSLVPNSKKVQFTLSTGANLIYDYYVNQWEVDVFPTPAADACLFQNALTYVQPNGISLKQTPGVYSDNGAVIPMSLKTGWMNLAGIGGYQRVRELQLVGTYKSPHTLTVNIYNDYATTPSQTVTIPVFVDPGLYQYRIHIKMQQCTAMQVEIIESQTGTGAEGFSLSALSLRVGVELGLYNLPAGASY